MLIVGADAFILDGTTHAVTAIKAVNVRTTDQGPWIEDLFVQLVLDDQTLEIGDEAPWFQQLFELFKKLPGFDYKAFIAATTCTDHATFECWKRP